MDSRVDDTFAEAFPAKAAGVIITARHLWLAESAALQCTGFASSIIGCPVEAGIDGFLNENETPDGRRGISVLFFHPDEQKLKDQILRRIGNCVLTCATTSVFNLLQSEKYVEIRLRFFGDGFERKDFVGGREVWRVPVMGGEFVYEEKIGIVDGVAGGNLIILARDESSGLEAASRACRSIREVRGTITPFPGGFTSAGSKVGSKKYKFMKATTNEAYCPTLRGTVDSSLPEDANVAYEIVINGVSMDAVKNAMKVGIEEALKVEGVVKITAGNYGGKLGPYKIHLRELISSAP